MTGFVCGVSDLGFLTPEDLAREDQWCCAGAAMGGPGRCSCWEPIYDRAQSPPIAATPVTRPKRCLDCAFRPDSPERQRGDDLEALPNFACHQGMRRPIEWRHPDGRVRPGDPADYQPPFLQGVPYKADGSPADLCAGWAQTHR